MLFINQLFEWHSLEAANPQIDRVLWIAPSGIDAVTIDINHPHAQPIWHKYQNLLAAFAANQISPVQNDPYAVIQLHNEEISLAQRQLLHKAWAEDSSAHCHWRIGLSSLRAWATHRPSRSTDRTKRGNHSLATYDATGRGDKLSMPYCPTLTYVVARVKRGPARTANADALLCSVYPQVNPLALMLTPKYGRNYSPAADYFMKIAREEP
jgi:hypothetical protein